MIFSLGISAIASDSDIFSIRAFLASSSFSNAAVSFGRAFSLRSLIGAFDFKASRASCISGVDCLMASEIDGATSDNSVARKLVRSASSPCSFANSKDFFSASVFSLFSIYCLLACSKTCSSRFLASTTRELSTLFSLSSSAANCFVLLSLFCSALFNCCSFCLS